MRPSGRQRGDGGFPAYHGRQAKEAHSDQERKGSGMEGAEREGENPQAAGRIKEEAVNLIAFSVESRGPQFSNKTGLTSRAGSRLILAPCRCSSNNPFPPRQRWIRRRIMK